VGLALKQVLEVYRGIDVDQLRGWVVGRDRLLAYMACVDGVRVLGSCVVLTRTIYLVEFG